MRSPIHLNESSASCDLRVPYTTSKQVDDVLVGLGRTEDIRFSPNKRRLAIAGFGANRIVVLDIRRNISREGERVSLPSAVEIVSADLAQPHGVDFIDDDTVVVANRSGRTAIFELPAAGGKITHNLVPIGIIDGEVINSPGSVVLAGKSGDQCQVLICNNASHTITKHSVDLSGESAGNGTILIRKWLDVPDGITLSGEDRIAISVHNMHSVMIYEAGRQLDETSDPDGVMRGVFFPHGLRFTGDDEFLLVADAGAPYLHVYARDDGWGGVHHPRFSLRVLSDADFLRGRHNPQEGGPKGLDIDEVGGLLATTCEMQPLALFDLAAILENATQSKHRTESDAPVELPETRSRDHQSASQVQYELELQHVCNRIRRQAEERANQAERRAAQAEGELAEARTLIHYLLHSKSWQVTAPMRWVFANIKSCAAWVTGRP